MLLHLTLSCFTLLYLMAPYSTILYPNPPYSILLYLTPPVSGINYENNHISYDNTGPIGEYLNTTTKKEFIDVEDTEFCMLNITKCKNRRFCILTNVLEVTKFLTDIIIIKSTAPYGTRENNKSKDKGSGIVLLFLCVIPLNMLIYDNNFDNNFSMIMGKTKDNIIKKGKV